MANSPKVEVFFLYDSAGNPLTGITPTFSAYTDTNGSLLSQPTITEIGGGAYKFTPDLSVATTAIVFVIDATTASLPRFLNGFVRPEDFAIDFLPDMNRETFGRWKVFTTGPDANRLVMYAEDNTTVLKKFDLKDSSGTGTFTNPFERFPL